ncbi:hypothetical protein NIES4071_102950 (plasmid) [Calothrix sp. NIES-4071]|nr:hypothetical protein NIES4071_102950 [Calothrix sp. NIES-4071]BAZ64676.1 hypothetical protein NIES4105_104090 [Calothrix sp. NIES-4105]
MLKLHSSIKTKFNKETFITKLTDSTLLPLPLRSFNSLLVDATNLENLNSQATQEFECLVIKNSQNIDFDYSNIHYHNLIILPSELNYLDSGDIIKVSPQSGKISTLYRKNSNYNVIFMTERCNSNCLMCSQPPRNIDDSYLVEDYLKAIPLMSPETLEIGITGGEPTLLKNDFLKIVTACRDYLPSTALHVLSNGKLFSYLQYACSLAQIQHPDLMIGIPLYSDIASIHNYVVQAEDAFDQTIRGILNLERTNVRVEIRVVVHQQTYQRLEQIARFIARNLPFVSHITFMGLEIMGHTRANLEQLWIDPVDYQDKLEEAVCYLNRRGMNVSIYNHQLCVLRKSLWPFAKKSISDWKNEYFPECDACTVKDKCGGFFSSSSLRFSNHINPIVSKYLLPNGI